MGTQSSSEDTVSSLFASFLRHINENAHSHWYLAIEDDKPSNTTNEARRLMSDKQREQLNNIEVMNDSSLQRYLGMDTDRYNSLLLACGLARRRGDKLLFRKDKWDDFMILHDLADVEVEKSTRTREAGYIRIGKKGHDYINSANNQARFCVYAPPRCNGINAVRSALKAGLNRLMPIDGKISNLESTAAASGSTFDSSVDGANGADKDIAGNEEGDNEAAVAAAAAAVAAKKKYVMLEKFGINVDSEAFDLTKKKNATNLKRLIGELIAIQQAHSEDADMIEFFRPQQNRLDTAVVIRSHKSDAAFKEVHRQHPYLDKVISCMDEDESVAATRLALHLAKNHKADFVTAAKTAGIAMTRTVNEIECAALMADAGLLETQFKIITRHVEYWSPIFVAFSSITRAWQGWKGFWHVFQCYGDIIWLERGG